MERQSYNIQVKEKEASPEKEISKIEASKLLDIEFKVMIIKMFKELNENYTSIKKDIKAMHKNQLEMKNAIAEMKNALERIKSKPDKAED